EAFLHRRGHADALTRVAGPRRLVIAWLDRCADLLERGGPSQIAEVIARLAASTSERTLALNFSAAARMSAADLGAVLGRTLRGGVFEELGWPALDEVVAQVGSKQREVQLAYAWPNVIVSDGSSVIVVDPERVVMEHELRPPPQLSKTLRLWPRLQPTFMYAGGQLLVMW